MDFFKNQRMTIRFYNKIMIWDKDFQNKYFFQNFSLVCLEWEIVRYFLIRSIPYFLSHIMTHVKLMLVNILGVSNRCAKL